MIASMDGQISAGAGSGGEEALREQWVHLSQRVVARRVELDLSRAELAEAAGLALRTLGDIESARRFRYDRTTLAKLEKGLEWPPGLITQILQPRRSSMPPRREERTDADGALERVMRSPDLTDAQKAQIVRLLIAEREAFLRQQMSRAQDLISLLGKADDDPPGRTGDT
jgi:transcriptional regulator with XRE-family HTH domain